MKGHTESGLCSAFSEHSPINQYPAKEGLQGSIQCNPYTKPIGKIIDVMYMAWAKRTFRSSILEYSSGIFMYNLLDDLIDNL